MTRVNKRSHSFTCNPRVYPQVKQGSRRSHFARAVHSHHPRQRRNGTLCCMTLFAANALQCIVNGEENPKIAPSPWDFVTLPEEDRAAVIGNMRKKFR